MKILIMFMFAVLLVGTISAANWDNTKPYDELQKKYTIKNFFGLGGTIAEYQLETNTDYCLIDCEATGNANLYEEGKLFTKFDFKDKKNKDIELNSFKIYVDSGKGWEEYNGEILPEGTYKWKITGKKNPLDSVDWIGNAFGEKFDKWAWWNGNWGKRIEVNITGDDNEELTNFTVLLNVTYDSNMQTDFDDLRFVDGVCSGAQNTELSYEFDRVIASNSALTWVKIPTLATGNNSICMYYYNPSASNSSDYINAWDDYYKGVYHFTANYLDSRGNGNGTASGTPDIHNTIIGNGINIAGGEYVDITNNDDIEFLDAPFTIEAFGNVTAYHATASGIVSGSVATSYGSYLSTDGTIRFGKTGTNELNSGLTAGLQTWNYMTIKYDAADSVTFNLNKTGTNTQAYSTTFSAVDMRIGDSAGNYWTGQLDEVRLSNVSRSSGWLNRSYQNANFSMFIFGTEETGGGGFIVNSQSYNSTTYETSYESFNVNVTINESVYTSSSAKLNYGGTEYSGTKTGGSGEYLFTYSSLPILNVSSPTNKNLFWNFTLVNSTGTFYEVSATQTQTINEILFGICNATNNIPYINITFKDEGNSSNLNASVQDGTTFNYWIGDSSKAQVYSYSNLSELYNYQFCFTPSDRTTYMNASFKYTSTGYVLRTWNPAATTYTNSTTNQTLYLLSSADGLYVTFSVLNSAGQAVGGVDVTATREILGVTTTIASGMTDDSGSVTFWLNPDYAHILTFSKTGYSTLTKTITPTQSSYIVTLGGTAAATNDYTQGISITTNPNKEFLDNHTTYTFNYTISSSYWTITSFSFDLYYGNGTSIGTQTSTDNGGTISLNANTFNASSIYMNYNYIISGNTTAYSRTWIIQETGGRGFSIFNFFQDLNTYIDAGMFGFDDFGKALLGIAIIIFVSGGLSMRYGIASEQMIMGVVFGVVWFLDYGIGWFPTISVGGITVIEHFLTFIAFLLLVGLIVSEETR